MTVNHSQIFKNLYPYLDQMKGIPMDNAVGLEMAGKPLQRLSCAKNQHDAIQCNVKEPPHKNFKFGILELKF